VENKQVKPFYKSEPVPVEHNKINPRYINITGENYFEVINDPTKHVMVLYVAKWCVKSRSLVEEVDDEVNNYKIMPDRGDYSDLIIAQIDVSENEVEGLDI
jgi:hypothetical protein